MYGGWLDSCCIRSGFAAGWRFWKKVAGAEGSHGMPKETGNLSRSENSEIVKDNINTLSLSMN